MMTAEKAKKKGECRLLLSGIKSEVSSSMSTERHSPHSAALSAPAVGERYRTKSTSLEDFLLEFLGHRVTMDEDSYRRERWRAEACSRSFEREERKALGKCPILFTSLLCSVQVRLVFDLMQRHHFSWLLALDDG